MHGSFRRYTFLVRKLDQSIVMKVSWFCIKLSLFSTKKFLFCFWVTIQIDRLTFGKDNSSWISAGFRKTCDKTAYTGSFNAGQNARIKDILLMIILVLLIFTFPPSPFAMLVGILKLKTVQTTSYWEWNGWFIWNCKLLLCSDTFCLGLLGPIILQVSRGFFSNEGSGWALIKW